MIFDVWPWAGCLILLFFHFLIGNMMIMTGPTHKRTLVRIVTIQGSDMTLLQRNLH